MGDFWAWAYSDLRENVTRGLLAEYLVGRALGCELGTRSAWDNYDLVTPEEIRVEVKASAYLQSWPQRELSKIQFSGLKGRSWRADGSYGARPEYRADVYVFCVQTAQAHVEYDMLDVGQWEVYVLPRDVVVEHGAASMALATVRRFAGAPVPWTELRAVVCALHARRSEASLADEKVGV